MIYAMSNAEKKANHQDQIQKLAKMYTSLEPSMGLSSLNKDA